MFSRSIRKAVQPYLHPTEELLAAVLAQNAGANAAAMFYALRGETATVRAFERADQAHRAAVAAAEPAGIRVETARGQRAEDLPRALRRARHPAQALDREAA